MKINLLFCLIKRKSEIHSKLMKIYNLITQVLFKKHVSRNFLHDLPSILTVYVHLTIVWYKNKN